MSVEMFWILDENKNPIAVSDMKEWEKWVAENGRIVGRTPVGEMLVSTVFLMKLIPEDEFGPEPRRFFETAVFHNGGRVVLPTVQYETYEEALAGHCLIVERERQRVGQ